MRGNQKGVTLIELIVALALVSVVAIIGWTAISIGMQHGATETNRTILQQDANLMISSLMAAHRGSHEYSIIFDDDQLKIESCTEDRICETNNISGKYDFTGTIVNNVPVVRSPGTPVIFDGLFPKEEHTEITLTITDLNNPKRTLTIETTLSRLLTSQN
ncbi:type II secretion system protein [Planococcus sp. CAU13]|uniref:type II secretion system protein n=1 Tax=Planococcus sp. CAU13 TaxID=1541197 RepID=UPI00052FF7D7|nr:type II secretion system protein [Planococcus sp. CAU13]